MKREFKLSEQERRKHREHLARYRIIHPDYYKRGLEDTKRRYWKYRMMVFAILGKRCVRCGFDDIRALQFDHIKGDGSQNRSKLGNHRRATLPFYRYYAEHPEEAFRDLQVLCATCNKIKQVENHEWHRATKHILS